MTQRGEVEAFEAAARLAVHRAGAILKQCWNAERRIERKSTAIDLVTEVDRACEQAILDVLTSAFPEHAVLAEESGAHGTHEFHQYPQVSISVALARGSQTILGVVYDPVREELFSAQRGSGAHLNDRRLQVSTTADLDSSLIASGFTYDRR